MNLRPVGVALQPVLSKIVKLGITRYVLSVTFLSGMLFMGLLMVAWAWVITVAPEVAIGLIAEVS